MSVSLSLGVPVSMSVSVLSKAGDCKSTYMRQTLPACVIEPFSNWATGTSSSTTTWEPHVGMTNQLKLYVVG